MKPKPDLKTNENANNPRGPWNKNCMYRQPVANRYPYLTATTSGLTYVVDRFKTWPHGAHITLLRGERSRLADYASDIL